MAQREIVVLGTSSMVPTRTRGHNGYVLFWDDDVILFDPGEGTQRQLTVAGITATDLSRIAITHLHGDHSLGLAGVVQRISLDGVPQVIPVSFPASGRPWIERLCDATVFYHRERLALQPITDDGVLDRIAGERAGPAVLRAARLSHTVDAVGYRLDEPDGVRFDPHRLAAAGLAGPVVGELRRAGVVRLDDGRVIRAEDVTVAKPGQSFAFVMDTRMCDAVGELADGVDLLVIEATYLDRDRRLAAEVGHLTALQAARVAAEAGVRSLVLTHFSQRYQDPGEFVAEVRQVFDGELTVANDLDRVRVPPRRAPSVG